MSEPAKENPKTPKRSRRKPAMEPLGWDEIVSQPGMGGYLSFLNGPVPLPHLQGPAPEVATDPGVDLVPQAETAPVIDLAPVSVSASAVSRPQNPDSFADPEVESAAGPVLTPVVDVASESLPSPEVDSAPGILPGQRLRIRRCAATHDGHSLGEEVLYQSLWKAASSESGRTRTIVIGWRGMSQLCRMTPKNCKINTQRLIRKLALEVLSPYNTPESIGTTYRIYSDEAILERRREAGLEWVVRSRGVEFVDPATGSSILPICAPTYQVSPR
jgi:hypothetical protein